VQPRQAPADSRSMPRWAVQIQLGMPSVVSADGLFQILLGGSR
jgi:hypothetical protein